MNNLTFSLIAITLLTNFFLAYLPTISWGNVFLAPPSYDTVDKGSQWVVERFGIREKRLTRQFEAHMRRTNARVLERKKYKFMTYGEIVDKISEIPEDIRLGIIFIDVFEVPRGILYGGPFWKYVLKDDRHHMPISC